MEQRRFFDASNLKDDVIAASVSTYDHVHALWSPSRHGRDTHGFGGDVEKSAASNDPSVSLRHVILDLQRKIDSGALKGVQIEYFDLVSRRCIALCRGEREKSIGVIDSGFTLTGPEGDDLSLRVLISFPVGPIGNQSESANLMPHFGLVPRGPKLARLSGAKIDHISRSLQRLCANNRLPVVTLLENCLRFVTQELTLAMNKRFEALKVKAAPPSIGAANQPGSVKDKGFKGGADAQRKGRGSEMFKLEIRREDKQEIRGEPMASVAARQPCPAYCGARFSGGGFLLHFDNFNDFVHVQIWKAGSVVSAEDGPTDTRELSFPRTYADLKDRIEVAKHTMLGRGAKANASPTDERFSGFSSGGISVDGSEVKLSPRKDLSPRSSDVGEAEKKMPDRAGAGNVLLSDELNESDLFDWHFEEPDKDSTAPSQAQGGARGDGQGSAKIDGAPSLDIDLDAYNSIASEFSSRETSVSTPVVTLFTLVGTALQRYLAESYTFGNLSCRRRKPGLKRRRSSWRESQGSQNDADHAFVQVLLVDSDSLEDTVPQDQPVTSLETPEGSFNADTVDHVQRSKGQQHAIITKRERAFLRYLATLPEEDYKDVRNMYHPIETKFATPAQHNHHVATLSGEADLVMLWTVLQLITDTSVAHKEMPAAASTLWAYHPCGRQLIWQFFRHYSRQHDVQTLATIACVIEDLERTSAWSHTEPLVDPEWRATCDGYKRAYADVLQRMGYYITRAEVLKYISRPPPHTSTHRENSTKSTFLRIASTDDKPFTCSICQVRVNGLVTFCKHCGHGGHSHHMNEWFHEYEVCPTGCGCICSTSVL